ncbi:uncharacterized protein LOC121419506 [Lytechinus variegatus]|uniref:uncharacterized protein LOC121419506 n=1 Tax=Lytechinus variegatus TaxID=7654 RepID=UPI001BB14560|nr:uncharacterized protein LOC121419506 [Lytechinus variegatus]
MTSITTIFIVLSACASITVAKPTQELSATVGGETNITCLFEDGTLRNIYWYFNTAQSWQRILTLAKGDLTVAPPYIGRATLQNDNNTLSLKGITVDDEGTYRCDVDRQGQPAVLHIYSDLNIYTLRPSTLPVVSPCAMIGESTLCTAQANDTFSLTCTLFNVYPVKEAVLTWYQDGKSVSSSYGETFNSDVITNLSLRIEVTQSRNLTCNASFVSAEGRQHTAVSVEAWILPLSGMTDEPDPKNETLNGGIIAAIVVCPLILLVAIVAIGVMVIKFRRRKQNKDAGTEIMPEDRERHPLISVSGNTNQDKDEEQEAPVSNDPESDSKHNKDEEQEAPVSNDPESDSKHNKDEEQEAPVSNDPESDSKHNKDEEQEAPVSNDPESDSKHNKDEEQEAPVSNDPESDSKHNKDEEQEAPVSNDPESDSKHNKDEEQEAPVSNDPESDSKHNKDEEQEAPVSNDPESDSKHNKAKMSLKNDLDFDDILKEIAKALPKTSEIDDLGKALGFEPADIVRYTEANRQGGDYMGTLDMLRTWRKRQTVSTERVNLRLALLVAKFASLADQHLSTPEAGSTPQASIPPPTLGATSINKKVSTKTTKASIGMAAAPKNSNASMNRKVTAGEIVKLSKLLPYGKYSELLVKLGFSLNYIQTILRRHSNDTNEAFVYLLNEWANKLEGGYIDDLDKALHAAEVGALIDEYKK